MASVCRTTFVGFLALASACRVASAQPASQPAAATAPGSALSSEDLWKALQANLPSAAGDPALEGADEIAAREKAIARLLQGFDDDIRGATRRERGIDGYPRDYVFCRNRAGPRLTGNVLRVGADQQFKDLPAATAVMRAGDMILLGKGEFHLPESRAQTSYNDIAIVGLGPELTRLLVPRGGGITKADRILFDGVRIDCQDDPLTDLRSGGGIHLRDCAFVNYNSGAGGSNAIYADFGVVLVERCMFDGEGGRAAGRGNGGDAFDLRVSAWLHARQTQFVENEEITRATTPTLLDRCTSLNTNVRSYGVTPYPAGSLWVRESPSLLQRSSPRPSDVHAFQHATDDVVFIEHVLDPSKPIDDDSKQLAQALLLHRRLPYWIGLIRHDDPHVRELAAARLKQLVDVEVNLPKEPQKDGERLADCGVLLACEVEYTRLITWFERSRDHLKWDEAAGRYRMQE